METYSLIIASISLLASLVTLFAVWGNGEVSMHVINEDCIVDAIDFAKQALAKQK